MTRQEFCCIPQILRMAIYTGSLPINGRLDELSFYNVQGQIRVRVCKPLSRNRVIKSPAFRNTMMHADWLARASKIGSAVYQALPKDFRQFWMYKAFVGEAIALLKHGMPDEEAGLTLRKIYAEVWQIKQAEENNAGKKKLSQKSKLRISHKAAIAGIPAVIQLKTREKTASAT